MSTWLTYLSQCTSAAYHLVSQAIPLVRMKKAWSIRYSAAVSGVRYLFQLHHKMIKLLEKSMKCPSLSFCS